MLPQRKNGTTGIQTRDLCLIYITLTTNTNSSSLVRTGGFNLDCSCRRNVNYDFFVQLMLMGVLNGLYDTVSSILRYVCIMDDNYNVHRESFSLAAITSPAPGLQWNPSNPDTIGPEESVLISEVSLFPGLKSTQT